MKSIIKSVRFQQMVVAVILASLIQQGYLGDGFIELLGKMLTLIAGLSAGIGTVDKFGKSIGNK